MWRDGYGMMGDWSGWGAGWMIFHGFSWLIVLALIVVGIVLLVRALPGTGEARENVSRRSPGLEALEARYARGEINREEFLEKKRDLGG